ncbi:MAG: hypothetical protein AB8C02_18170 [Halioglobus sp.]
MSAIYAYTGAAVLAILCMGWWLRRTWRPAWLALFLLVCAAVGLTPAFPRADVATMAPAFIVAGFAFFTEGYEAAEHALKPLGAALAIAAGLALLLRITFLKGPSKASARQATDKAASGTE